MWVSCPAWMAHTSIICNYYCYYVTEFEPLANIMDIDKNGLLTGARSSCAARKRDNWFPVCLYIELNTCINVKSYPASRKHLFNVYTTSNIVCYTNVLCLLGMCCRVAWCIGHGVYTSMIYVHTCALTVRTFSREKHTFCAFINYSCCNI